MVVFSPIYLTDTKIIYDYNFVASIFSKMFTSNVICVIMFVMLETRLETFMRSILVAPFKTKSHSFSRRH